MARRRPGSIVAALLAVPFAAGLAGGTDRPPEPPRVLIIGDSISIGYTPHVVRLLEGEAVVERIPGNGQHTRTGLAKIDEWLGEGAWDVIHFNWGLWDLCYRRRGDDGRVVRDKERGRLTTTIAEYEANLDTLVGRMAATGATLVWASTTPVPAGEGGRFQGDAVRYNEAARRVMDRHGVRITDLHAAVEPRFAELEIRPGDVHFSNAGSAYLGEQVAAGIRAAIDARGRAGEAPPRPNVVVIISDDAGYADFSFQGSVSVPTPHLDSIAADGVRFTNGYVTASVCSPSRAGLLTGRYQQRFGHEFNIPPRLSETNGLPTSEVLLPRLLRGRGYRTIALGKWHLGYADHFHPLSRGFDDHYGFLQGARSYWPIEGTRLNRLLRDREPVEESFAYMTDELGAEAAAFIERHRDRPFFLYLSFNAVHTPMHARPEILEHVPEGGTERRRKLIAMTISLDEAVGRVLAALREHGLEDDTLLFFVNDNGGATNNASINEPLRGTKGTPFEGGIRIPFLARWPGHLPAGATYDPPVSTLDIAATALSVAGYRGTLPGGLDGVDLMPFLTGAEDGRPHRTLFWRRGENRAVRDRDWKLVQVKGGEPMLFDLAADPGETRDLAEQLPGRVERMLDLLEQWGAGLSSPRWSRRQAPAPAAEKR